MHHPIAGNAAARACDDLASKLEDRLIRDFLRNA
jgi:hypothetical protein